MTEKTTTKAPKIPKAKLIEMAKRRVEVMATIKELEAEKAKIDAKLLTLPVGHTEAGDLIVTITPFRLLDSSIIETKFPVEKFPDIYKLTLDTSAFKNIVAPKDLEKYQKVQNRLSVK